jgi:hypothetical protein
MNLGQFHDRISQAIKRGNSLDGLIPYWVAEAALTIEQNYTFSWMRRVGEVTKLADDPVPNRIAFPNNRVKSFEWIRVVTAFEPGSHHKQYRRLQGVEAHEAWAISAGMPEGFWLDGLEYIYVDAVAGQDMVFQLAYNEYTDWPLSEAATPSLLARGQNLLFAETMILFSTEQKDERMAQAWAARAQQGYNFLLRAEEELKMQHQNDQRMVYSGLR